MRNVFTPAQGLALALLPALLVALLPGTPASAATYDITQSGLSFSPSALTIAAGDTVTWQWTTGVHTVTNGANLSDPAAATLFDAPLTSAAPTFTFVFTEVGVVPYFCRPHLGLGMTGTITVEAASSVDDTPLAARPILLANVPNPFNPRTEIAFELPASGPVRLAIHDLAGRLVRTIIDGDHLAAGSHRRDWNGHDDAGRIVAAGVYLYVLETGNTRTTRTMTLVK